LSSLSISARILFHRFLCGTISDLVLEAYNRIHVSGPLLEVYLGRGKQIGRRSGKIEVAEGNKIGGTVTTAISLSATSTGICGTMHLYAVAQWSSSAFRSFAIVVEVLIEIPIS
jgi:hypothetical protein